MSEEEIAKEIKVHRIEIKLKKSYHVGCSSEKKIKTFTAQNT